MGITWDGELRRQSEHLEVYAAHLAELESRGLLYPCFCSRADIAAEIAQAGGAPHDLPNPQPSSAADGAPPIGPAPLDSIQVYPGICRKLAKTEQAERIAQGRGYALRLDVAKALAQLYDANSPPLSFFDQTYGQVKAQPALLGDVVLGRKEVRTSYHLSVTIDDHLQGVTLVTRGEDLFFATHIHRLLQALFGFAPPAYAHHRLLQASDGSRLAKRRGAISLRALRQDGKSAAEIWALVGLPPLF